jgi:hypothetical protein
MSHWAPAALALTAIPTAWQLNCVQSSVLPPLGGDGGVEQHRELHSVALEQYRAGSVLACSRLAAGHKYSPQLEKTRLQHLA